MGTVLRFGLTAIRKSASVFGGLIEHVVADYLVLHQQLLLSSYNLFWFLLPSLATSDDKLGIRRGGVLVLIFGLLSLLLQFRVLQRPNPSLERRQAVQSGQVFQIVN